MSSGKDFVVRSLGYGVYLVGSTVGDAATESEAREAAGQIGHVLEVADDPDTGLKVVLVDGGHATSKYEAAIAADPEVAGPVRRAALRSPRDSALRARLELVDSACSDILKGAHGTPLGPRG